MEKVEGILSIAEVNDRWGDVGLGASRVVFCRTIETEPCDEAHRTAPRVSRGISVAGVAMHVLCQRRTRKADNSIDAVLPRPHGTSQQVNNVERRLREIRKCADRNLVTPEAFRQSTQRKA